MSGNNRIMSEKKYLRLSIPPSAKQRARMMRLGGGIYYLTRTEFYIILNAMLETASEIKDGDPKIGEET